MGGHVAAQTLVAALLAGLDQDVELVGQIKILFIIII